MILQTQIFKERAFTLIDESTGIELGELTQGESNFFLLFFGHGTFEVPSKESAIEKANELLHIEAYKLPSVKERANANQFNLF